MILNATSSNYYFNNDFGTGTTLRFINTSTTFMNATSAGVVYFPSGNVGIGTSSPGYKLEVIGTQRTSGNFYFYNTVTNVASSFSDQRGAGFDASTGQFQVAANATTALELSRFGTSGSVLNIRNAGTSVSNFGNDGGAWFSGNVGIGTTAPSTLLDIRLATTDNVTGSVSSSYAIATFVANSSGGGTRGLQIGGPTGGISSPVFLKIFGTSARFAVLNQSNVENLTILDGGNVGIGTTNPGDKLQVDGNVYANAFHAVGSVARFVAGGGTYMTGLNGSSYGSIQSYSDASGTGRALALNPSGGNVGIGTTSPLAKLDIYGNTDTYAGMAKIYLTDSSTNTNSRNWSIGNGGSAYGNLTFAVSATKGGNAGDATSVNTMVINSSGNVGIGTTSPGYKLDVSGGTARIQNNPSTNDWGLFLQNTNTGVWGVSQFFNLYGYASSPAGDFSVLQIRADYPAYGRVTFAVKEQAQSTALDALVLRGNGQVYMNAGFVGIGTTSPGQALAVSGNVYVGNLSNTLNFTGGGNARFLEVGSGGGGDALLVTHASGYGVGYFGYSAADDRLVIACDNGGGVNKIDFIVNAGSTTGGGTNNLSGVAPAMRITSGGTVQPGANGTQDLGTSSLRWATVYTSDLDMSNGIGDYTIVEGEEDLFLYNNKTNKVFKFVIQEVNPSEATPKMKK